MANISPVTRLVVPALVWMMSLAATHAAVSTVITSPSVASCFVAHDCAEPCHLTESGLGCSLFCPPGSELCLVNAIGVTLPEDPTWNSAGQIGVYAGDTQAAVTVELSGERSAPGTFTLNLWVFSFYAPAPVQVDAALFRFSGDPGVFDGIEVSSLDELIGLGLVDPGDVLWSEMLLVADDGEFSRDFTVDVTGIPDEQIVLFSSSTSDLPLEVPALSNWGGLLLAALLSFLICLHSRSRSSHGSRADN